MFWLPADPISASTWLSRADPQMGGNTAAIHTYFGARRHGNAPGASGNHIQSSPRAACGTRLSNCTLAV